MERIGEIKENNFGTQMKVIRYGSSSDIDVEFLDDYHYVKRNTTYSNFKKGTIKNPFDPTAYGVGYVGVGKYPTKENNKLIVQYVTWMHILERCYYEKAADKHQAYYGISEVCKEWLNYQNFAQWYDENRYETEGRLHIDKDILYPGNKLYSPYHCILVPQRINMLFLNKPNKRGLPNGISKEGNRYYAMYNGKSLGSADTMNKAYDIYSKAKKKAIINVANEYKNKIPQLLYDALMRYEVRIENDKNIIE